MSVWLQKSTGAWRGVLGRRYSCCNLCRGTWLRWELLARHPSAWGLSSIPCNPSRSLWWRREWRSCRVSPGCWLSALASSEFPALAALRLFHRHHDNMQMWTSEAFHQNFISNVIFWIIWSYSTFFNIMKLNDFQGDLTNIEAFSKLHLTSSWILWSCKYICFTYMKRRFSGWSNWYFG